MLTPHDTDPTTCSARDTARAEFVALIAAQADPIPLLEATAWICAEERGSTDISPIMEAMDAVCQGLFIPEETHLVESIARINHHLFEDIGFSGDDDEFDHPNNSLIDAVLERKKGLPIILSVVTMIAAERAGVQLHGIGFPTHFLLSPEGALPRFFIDPFHKDIFRFDIRMEISHSV